jgi:hypothetical protein
MQYRALRVNKHQQSEILAERRVAAVGFISVNIASAIRYVLMAQIKFCEILRWLVCMKIANKSVLCGRQLNDLITLLYIEHKEDNTK